MRGEMTMARRSCAACGDAQGMVRFEGETFVVEHGGARAEVPGLSGWRCAACGEVEFDPESSWRCRPDEGRVTLGRERKDRKMTPSAKVVAGLAILLASITAAGWWLSTYQENREAQVAAAIAQKFLDGRALQFADFEGPSMTSRPHTERIFVWKHRSGMQTIQLDVSPLGDFVCLYRVADGNHFQEMACEDLK